MNVTLDLYKLLRNAYLCDLDTDNVQYKRLLEHSIHSISFNTQLMLNQSNSDILYVESSEEDSQILVIIISFRSKMECMRVDLPYGSPTGIF